MLTVITMLVFVVLVGAGVIVRWQQSNAIKREEILYDLSGRRTMEEIQQHRNDAVRRMHEALQPRMRERF